MCILFLAINQHPIYPLLICANRDEFPTMSAHFWPESPELLAGKDLEAGGSWLGINKQGYFAAVTNIRTGNKPSIDKKSRGELVTLALQEDSPINEDWLSHRCEQYNPFNLIYGSAVNLYCFNSVNREHRPLVDGFHAISNGSIDDIWPKMATGEKQLKAVVKSTNIIEPDTLFNILGDQSRPNYQQLPKSGISDQWELLLSSIFICSAEYGTRSSSLIMKKSDDATAFIEAEYDQLGTEVNRKYFSL